MTKLDEDQRLDANSERVFVIYCGKPMLREGFSKGKNRETAMIITLILPIIKKKKILSHTPSLEEGYLFCCSSKKCRVSVR